MIFHSFRRRLLKRLTLLALIAMLLVALAQILLITREQRQQQELLLNQLTSAQLPLLQVALWDIEIRAVQGQLEHIADLPAVAAVRLHSETGLALRAGEAVPSQRAADTTLSIPSLVPDGPPLGELEVFYTNEGITQRIIDSVQHRILEFSLYTLLLFMVLFRMLHREVGRPLQMIAAYVSSLKPEKGAPRLVLERKKRIWYDEIDLVVRGFDTLREGISHYAEQHERAISALASERDSLDRRVEERTSELAYLNGFLRLVSGSSLKLMHLDHVQYPHAMRQRLRALGQYLQLEGGALFDLRAGESMKMRASWTRDEDNRWLDEVQEMALCDGPPGWSLTRPDARTLLIAYLSSQRCFCYAVRSRHAAQPFPAEREELLLGAGQWLFSLVQHWDHVIGLEEARQNLLELSRTDPLTGLANRRRFEEHQTDELRRALRQGYPVSLLMLDIDYFKGFNDLYGHAAGDECLKSIADVLAACFKRTGEMPARLGGEEFAVLLPGYDGEGACYAAESLLRAIVALDCPHEGSIWGRVTASIGCASWHGPGEPEPVIQHLMNSADAALYKAKRAGRNRVALCPESDLSGEQ